MREKGINQNDLIININDNKNSRTSNKTRTKRNTRRSVKINSRILKKKWQMKKKIRVIMTMIKISWIDLSLSKKKKIDDFIKIKKVELKSNQNNK